MAISVASQYCVYICLTLFFVIIDLRSRGEINVYLTKLNIADACRRQ